MNRKKLKKIIKKIIKVFPEYNQFNCILIDRDDFMKLISIGINNYVPPIYKYGRTSGRKRDFYFSHVAESMEHPDNDIDYVMQTFRYTKIKVGSFLIYKEIF